MRITLTLKRFHSIAAATIQLANPAFFVGCNGSGKSNLADAFSFLSEITTVPLQAAFDRRGGIHAVATRTPRVNALAYFSGEQDPVGISIVIENDDDSIFASARYAFEARPLSRFEFEIVREQCLLASRDGERQYFDRVGTKVNSNVPWMSGIQHWSSVSALLMPLVGSANPFHRVSEILKNMRVYAIEPGKLRDAQDPDTGAALRRDGSNATSVLNELKQRSPETLARMWEILSCVTPSIRRVWTVRQGKQFALRFRQCWADDKKLDFEAFSMSDGTLRALGLLLAVFQRPTPSLVVIEEPEATIHPGALGTILDVLRNSAKSMQLVVTTHSPDILDSKWIQPEHLRILTWEHGITRVCEIGDMSREALRAHLMGAGELLRSNALEPADLFDNPSGNQLVLFEDPQ